MITNRELSLNRNVIYYVQTALISILKIPCAVYGYRIIREADVGKGSKLIIVNHVSEIDVFTSITTMSFGAHRSFGPVRVLVKNKYIDTPLIGLFLRVVGSFPAFDHHKHESGISRSIDLLDSGQSVMIFPQGRIYRYKDYEKGKRAKLRTGAKVISPGHKVLPVLMKKEGYRKYVVQGKEFDAEGMDIYQMMDKIWELEKHIPAKNKRSKKG